MRCVDFFTFFTSGERFLFQTKPKEQDDSVQCWHPWRCAGPGLLSWPYSTFVLMSTSTGARGTNHSASLPTKDGTEVSLWNAVQVHSGKFLVLPYDLYICISTLWWTTLAESFCLCPSSLSWMPAPHWRSSTTSSGRQFSCWWSTPTVTSVTALTASPSSFASTLSRLNWKSWFE